MICEKFAAEGCNVVINYATSKDKADELAKKIESYGVKAICIQADCGVPEDNARLIKETVSGLGGLDVIVANAGWTRFAEFGDLNDLSLEEWNKVCRIFCFGHWIILTFLVLGMQCNGTFTIASGGSADIRQERTRWFIHHHIFRCRSINRR